MIEEMLQATPATKVDHQGGAQIAICTPRNIIYEKNEVETKNVTECIPVTLLSRVADGARTRGLLGHNQVLYH